MIDSPGEHFHGSPPGGFQASSLIEAKMQNSILLSYSALGNLTSVLHKDGGKKNQVIELEVIFHL